MAHTRRLLALAPLSGTLPAGIMAGRLELEAVRWEGAASGRGHLAERRIRARLEGKLAGGSTVRGVLRPPSLVIEPLAEPALGRPRLAAVR